MRAAGFEAATDFDAIISADRFELLKPAPDVFLAAAQAVGIHPQNCVVLEDAPAGIQASRAAGKIIPDACHKIGCPHTEEVASMMPREGL